MTDKGAHEFWKSAGMHLVEVDDEGWLTVTPDFLRAYYTRAEMHPNDESCAEEIRLHEALMAEPFMPVEDARLALLADKDAADNYRMVRRFRDCLSAAGTIEGAYLTLIKSRGLQIPPVFLDQLVHLILRNILLGADDPIRLRAAEIFFREQNVSADGGRLMLADEEIVDMHARAGKETGLWQLLADSGTPAKAHSKTIELDVIDDSNAHIYWARSDGFDTVIDFRFEQPALDAFARVIEAWIAHLAGLSVKVQPLVNIEDSDWRWHIGMDVEANRILNMLYEGKTPALADLEQIIGLFEMRISDSGAVIDRVKGMPVYLGLAKTTAGRVKMKPQNLLVNLPLIARG